MRHNRCVRLIENQRVIIQNSKHKIYVNHRHFDATLTLTGVYDSNTFFTQTTHTVESNTYPYSSLWCPGMSPSTRTREMFPLFFKAHRRPLFQAPSLGPSEALNGLLSLFWAFANVASLRSLLFSVSAWNAASSCSDVCGFAPNPNIPPRLPCPRVCRIRLTLRLFIKCLECLLVRLPLARLLLRTIFPKFLLI